MREREVASAATEDVVGGLVEDRLRVLEDFLLLLSFEVAVVVASGIISECMRRTCWMKRSLRLKSLKSSGLDLLL